MSESLINLPVNRVLLKQPIVNAPFPRSRSPSSYSEHSDDPNEVSSFLSGESIEEGGGTLNEGSRSSQQQQQQQRPLPLATIEPNKSFPSSSRRKKKNREREAFSSLSPRSSVDGAMNQSGSNVPESIGGAVIIDRPNLGQRRHSEAAPMGDVVIGVSGGGGVDADPETVPRSSRKGKGRHRRTMSGSYEQSPMRAMGPPMQVNFAPPPSPRSGPGRSSPSAQGGGGVGRPHHHRRQLSWSGGTGAPSPMMVNNLGVAMPPHQQHLPMQQYHFASNSAGSPFMPNLSSSDNITPTSDTQNNIPYFPPPPGGSGSSTSGRRKRKDRQHRRSHSSSSAVPTNGGGAYSDFFQTPADMQQQQPLPALPAGGGLPRRAPLSPRSQEFSPRSEFLSITGNAFHQSLRGQKILPNNATTSPMVVGSPMNHPYSPSTAQRQVIDMPPTLQWTPTRNQQRNLYGGMHHPNDAAAAQAQAQVQQQQMYMGSSPHPPPMNDSFLLDGSMNGGSRPRAFSGSGSINGGSRPRVYSGSGGGTPIGGDAMLGGGGGEAVFLANKLNKQNQRPKSSRVRHMRQKSAQLFMEEFKGQPQPPACRDIVFLLLFLFHLVGMMYLGTTYGVDAFQPHGNNIDLPNNQSAMSSIFVDSTTTTINLTTRDESFPLLQEEIKEEISASLSDGIELYYGNLVIVACLSGAFAIVVSTLLFALVSVTSQQFVKVALVLAMCVSFAWGTIGIGLSPKNIVPITGFMAFAFCVGYSVIVWERIPFCASNLLTALSGLKANKQTVFIAFFFQVVVLVWSVYFIVVVVGVFDALQWGEIGDLSKNVQIVIYTMLGISFYWTYNVILNVVQVTTAGIIGSWWYFPSGNSSGVVCESFFKSVFYGLGSICFGSLLVDPVRVLRQLSALIRPASANDSLLCCHECLNCIQSCIAGYVDSLSDHFNTFGFTYVGLYGYGFLDAGHRATELFRRRGWTMIVTDDLVSNVLLLTSVVIGGATGCFSHLVLDFGDFAISSLGRPSLISFVAGLLIGLVVTSVLFGVISSSVNTVIVCFAASPVDFENNHPELSREMRTAWRNVWPGCMDLVDLRIAANAANINNSVNLSNHGSSVGSGGIFFPPPSLSMDGGGQPPQLQYHHLQQNDVDNEAQQQYHRDEEEFANERHPLLKK